MNDHHGTIHRARVRTLVVLALATAVGSVGLAAGGTAGALLGAELSGTEAAAGLPLGALVLGSAAAALLVSGHARAAGRGKSLALGYLAGLAGAVLVVAAAGAGSFALLLLGSAVLGAGNIAVFLARYAAADVSPERSRGRALGGIFFAAAVGSVLGPNLLGPSSAVAGALGLPPLSGLYLVAILCFGLAALILTAASSPRLPGTGGGAALLGPHPRRAAPRQALLAGLKGSGVRTALLTLATVNGVMVAIMAIAPIHLVAHNHSLAFVGAIVGFHVAGMFAPSPLSGWLVDRVGPRPVAGIGLLFLLAAALAGVGDDGGSAGWMATALTLLGVGWNFGVVGGSALLAASISASERPQAEGLGEVVMGVAAGAGALLAGVIVASGGFTALSLMVAAAAAVTMLALIDIRRGSGRARRVSLTNGD